MTLAAAIAAHNQAAADRAAAEREMGARWRDAAARVVEQQILAPLTIRDRQFASELRDLDIELTRALRLIDQ